MKLGVSKVKSDMAEILKKILIQGLRGIKSQKLGILDIFSKTGL